MEENLLIFVPMTAFESDLAEFLPKILVNVVELQQYIKQMDSLIFCFLDHE